MDHQKLAQVFRTMREHEQIRAALCARRKREDYERKERERRTRERLASGLEFVTYVTTGNY